ncbi:MAG: sel1 repeat family protein [Verrucomicrobia bacterium]|nr:sel1 repeat family protein [Verrucomicrobiota bacterium]MBS0637757.1 sel1 repeat family protein [Verrucomicrobiota bacterium]
MNITGVHTVSDEVINVQPTKPIRKPKEIAVTTIIKPILNPAARPAGRKPKAVVLDKDTLSLQKLEKYFSSKSLNFTRAGKLAGDLFGVYLADALSEAHKQELMRLFSEVAAQPRAKIDKEFYAFIRGALTYHTHQQKDYDPTEVERGYKEAIALGDAFSTYYLGEFYDNIDRYQESVDQFLECTRRFPQEPYAYRELGKYYRQGWDNVPADLEKAKTCFLDAISRGCEESLFNLADMLEDLPVSTTEQRQEVISLYRRAINKGIAAAAFNLGLIYQTGWHKTQADGVKLFSDALVDMKKAEQYFRRSYKLEPQVDTLVALGETLAQDPERTQDAKKIIKDLREQGSEDKAAELERIVNSVPVDEVVIINIPIETEEE